MHSLGKFGYIIVRFRVSLKIIERQLEGQRYDHIELIKVLCFLAKINNRITSILKNGENCSSGP